jgi:hypothetical protein
MIFLSFLSLSLPTTRELIEILEIFNFIIFVGIFIAIVLISMIGLWNMKKWAVHLFTLCACINQIFEFATLYSLSFDIKILPHKIALFLMFSSVIFRRRLLKFFEKVSAIYIFTGAAIAYQLLFYGLEGWPNLAGLIGNLLTLSVIYFGWKHISEMTN